MKSLIRFGEKAFHAYNCHKLTPLQPLHSDLYIVSYPKSGISWLRFILSNIISIECGRPNLINFMNINDSIPDIHVSRAIPTADSTGHGHRIIKSHSEFNPLYKKIIYLYRNPHKVMRSYYRMWTGLKRYHGSFINFVTDKKMGINAWCRHVDGWMYKSHNNQRMGFLSYEQLAFDAENTISGLLNTIGWRVEPAIVKESVKLSTLHNMQALEDQRVDSDLRRKYNINRSSDYRFVGNISPIDCPTLEEADALIKRKSEKYLQILFDSRFLEVSQ